jgi:hypothetical protein
VDDVNKTLAIAIAAALVGAAALSILASASAARCRAGPERGALLRDQRDGEAADVTNRVVVVAVAVGLIGGTFRYSGKQPTKEGLS